MGITVEEEVIVFNKKLQKFSTGAEPKVAKDSRGCLPTGKVGTLSRGPETRE